MIFIKKINEKYWWELYLEKMMAFNYDGGYHNITKQELDSSEILECDGWHELYLKKGYCPLQVNIKWTNVWVSPEGLFYNGDAHENRAEEILEIIYGETNYDWSGDKLEELGWIRATKTLMWEIRIDSGYWNNKSITQKQYDALYDWCKYHNKDFPQNIEVK